MMADKERRPTVLVFAGPNGSGKSTVTRGLSMFGTYVNTDDIKKEYHLNDLEAAQQAEALRNALLEELRFVCSLTFVSNDTSTSLPSASISFARTFAGRAMK